MTYVFFMYNFLSISLLFNYVGYGQDTDQKVDTHGVTTTFSYLTSKYDNGTNEVLSTPVRTESPNFTQAENFTGDHVTVDSEISVLVSKPLETSTSPNTNDSWPDYMKLCPSNVVCDRLSAECIVCNFNETCDYGRNTSVTCRPKDLVICLGHQNFTRWYSCRYCYQMPSYLHLCTNNTSCRVISTPRQSYQANCTVKENVLCLGKRTFYKMLPCNWTSGKRWSTALILSITIGGFGADRFYLGLWREGIGKLFSFGGLGVWTLVDVVLVATGYIGPSDGSLYIW